MTGWNGRHSAGGPAKPEGEKHEFKYEGSLWDPERFVVARVDEVLPHPNADKLVLCRLNDGAKEMIILTGAPTSFV
jgi:phenylalanyl-tRNA synthetase beta chain